ncbi:flagellar filament capping protein FliD [Paenibacillus sp. NAIST15-1]|uniref:flagellar filament capping protein FliD n=1 Tax=Paenibacillus sp. NAIST15-1 TaxID=1605994 RepID=UPI00086C0B0D|nr:flagellar filament capping protein FliD [Paenibacillus sp. NAIST15-1]GAV12418.1 flagellar protein FliD [Paenibacillus sp. NAIST15-1]
MINPIRLSGMSSGLDTDKMINDLMKAARQPANKLKQQKQTLMWQREEYRNMNSMMSSFKNLADKLRFSSTFNKLSASSSNNSVITASANSSAGNGSYVVKVDQLATSSTNVGDAFSSAVDLKAKGLTPGEFSITVDGKEQKFEINADSTLESVMNSVNKANIGVRMSFDSINKRFMLTSASTGDISTFSINDSSGALSTNFNIQAANTNVGQNAKATINGVAMEMANNSFEFNGVKFDLKGVSTSEVTVTVTRDTQDLVSQIKDFVEKYNEIVDKIQAKTTERPNRNYYPLSDEEKESMKDSQIQLWESKAKAGLLYRDDILQDAMNSLRRDLTSPIKDISGSIKSLKDIGITFKPFVQGNTKDLAKIQLDEQKLQDAINSNPDEVMKLFTKSSNLDSKDPNYRSEIGYGERLYDTLGNSMKKITKKIGSGSVSDAVDGSIFGNRLRDMNKKLDSLEDKLKMTENRYYKQFTAMEKAIQKLNSQGSWLAQQLGQG